MSEGKSVAARRWEVGKTETFSNSAVMAVYHIENKLNCGLFGGKGEKSLTM